MEEEAEARDYICKECGHGEIDRTENPDSVLCRTCREKYIHYPISKVLIFFSIILVILMGAAFSRFPKVLKYYKMYEQSEQIAAEGGIKDAIDGLYTVLEQYPDSTEVAVRLTDIAMAGGYYDDAANMLSNYFSDVSMDDVTVTRLNQYIDKLDRYYTTCDIVHEMRSKLDASLSEKETMEAMSNQLKERLKVPNQDRAVLYYYLAVYVEDREEAKECLRKCLEEDAAFLDAKVVLGDFSRREGNLADAEKYYNQVLSEDNTYTQAMRGLAIIRLLKGKKEEGLESASRAYELEPDGLYNWETYMIALKENGKDVQADNLVKEYLSKGNELDTDTKEYLDNKITLKDYYMESEEDV